MLTRTLEQQLTEIAALMAQSSDAFTHTQGQNVGLVAANHRLWANECPLRHPDSISQYPCDEFCLALSLAIEWLRVGRIQEIYRVETATNPVGCTIPGDYMPDDCHDFCIKQGQAYGIYYPYRWVEGTGHYQCTFGHTWTCGWGHDWSGEYLPNRGKNQAAPAT